MANKERLQRLLDAFSNKDTQVEDAFKAAHKGVQKVVDKIKEEADSKAAAKISETKSQVGSIITHLEALKKDLKKGEGDLNSSLNQELDSLRTAMADYRTAGLSELGDLTAGMDKIKENIKGVSKKINEIPRYEGQINSLQIRLNELNNSLDTQKKETKTKIDSVLAEYKKTISDLEAAIKKLRTDAMSAIAGSHGGNMNRNILVNSNPSTLGRYTDLNIKAGSNITLSYQNNDNLKTTDLTIAGTGGGSGITRSISTVSVSSVVAATASTDIVVIVGAGVKLTMPTAVGNTNLYTIKNKFASSVMVAANGAETIDGDANIILATKYVSVDLISDNANWQIT